uniref:Uncharacterized protein n=1 Tax=Tetranychus urticae TaxID=32264 RepID=T1KKU5_TETUR
MFISYSIVSVLSSLHYYFSTVNHLFTA